MLDIGSAACITSDWVIVRAEMSSVTALMFWVSLARSGAPVAVQPTAATSARAAMMERRGWFINRSDQGKSFEATADRAKTRANSSCSIRQVMICGHRTVRFRQIIRVRD